eukprot:7804794-Alexandrium_andersonii.AAC.1
MNVQNTLSCLVSRSAERNELEAEEVVQDMPDRLGMHQAAENDLEDCSLTMRYTVEEGELQGKFEDIDKRLADKAELEAKLKELGGVVNPIMLKGGQAAETEAKQEEFEGVDDPINMKYYKRESALAEGRLRNKFEDGDSEKIEQH